MTTTTPEAIQGIAVNIVKDFVTKQASLNDGIAKVASEMELNPEQIKRVVETCNTVTYLTLQKQASDKTLEFPIADYNAVLGKMVMPKGTDTTVTEGQFKEATAKVEPLQKEASYVPDQQTVQAWTRAEYIRNKAMLEKLAYDGEAIVQNIGDLTAELRKEVYCLEKLAEVTTEDEFVKIGRLIRPIIRNAAGEIKLVDMIFKEAELTDTRRLVALYKEACEIAKEKEYRAGLEKRAIAGAVAGILGGTIGGSIGLAAKGTASAAGNMMKNIGKSKIIHPLDVAGTALSEPKPASNIWDNLQGRQRRI